MMRSAIVVSVITALALGVPVPDPFEVGLGIPAVVVDGQPIKVPEAEHSLAHDIGIKSKFSIGDHTIELGGGAGSVGGHATGGSVGNDPGSSITITGRHPEPNLAGTSGLLNTGFEKRGLRIISRAPAIGIIESAGGSLHVSEGLQAESVTGKHGSGIANGGNGGDALVPNSRAGNGGNGGIILRSPE